MVRSLWLRPGITQIGIDSREACRRAVEDQIVAFKRKVFEQKGSKQGLVKSELTGSQVDYPDAHVDHKPPHTFNKLVDEFIKKQGIRIEEIEIAGFEDGSVEKKFADPEMTRSWAEYHRKHARLRIVSRAENLSTVKRQTRNQLRQHKPKKAHAPKSRRS